LRAECAHRAGRVDVARQAIESALENAPDFPDLLVAAANLESLDTVEGLAARLGWINRLLEKSGIARLKLEEGLGDPLDRLVVEGEVADAGLVGGGGPLVTVIVPVYNARATIETALRAIACQTWRNMEVLVVDDGSSDGTRLVVEEFIAGDSRFRLLRTEKNSGPYVARNVALAEAAGEYVTCHDADDWSHPEKIERQVMHLLENPEVVANMSQQVRVYPDLTFFRRGNHGYYIFQNQSSLLFRKGLVRERLGFWDSVRFGADSEMVRRMERVFGSGAVVELPFSVLAFQRQAEGSLTACRQFGFHGFPMGARREYLDGYRDFHKRSKKLDYSFPLVVRPFAVPAVMLPWVGNRACRRHALDIILAGDFSVGSPTLEAMVEQVRWQKKEGFRTGLFQVYRYAGNPHRLIAPEVRDLMDGRFVRMLVYPETVSADVVLFHDPRLAMEEVVMLPSVLAGNVYGIFHDEPGGLDAGGMERMGRRFEEWFGRVPVWHVGDSSLVKSWQAFADKQGIQIQSKPWKAKSNHPSHLWKSLESAREKHPLLPPVDVDALREETISRGLDREPDTFVLCRIIGNDLVPRHAMGQSRTNVRFILENEPSFEGCEKRWIINRIVDVEEERAIIGLLDEYKQKYVRIPFEAGQYVGIEWDTGMLPWPGYLAGHEYRLLDDKLRSRVLTAAYRHKNNYIMNNNGARNVALEGGRRVAKWVLPWDGNCFLTEAAWREVREAVIGSGHLKYFVVPMARIMDNAELLDGGFRPEAREEPQIVFRRDAAEVFDTTFCYGRRPKVELLWRLGVPGPWDSWLDSAWDLDRPAFSEEAGQYGVAGWVARLFSGAGHLEEEGGVVLQQRGLSRDEAIRGMIQRTDMAHAGRGSSGLLFYSEVGVGGGFGGSHLEALGGEAAEAMRRGPYSVVDKTTLPPGGEVGDYWHPAPYWWPDPEAADGLPYIWRDGQRVPGTILYESESDKYDRTRVQRLFDDTLALSLAGRVMGRSDYLGRAALLVRVFFLDSRTAMNPHLRYAQVRAGHNGNEGAATGIIEFKDLYFFLDAVRILAAEGELSGGEVEGFRGWLAEYLEWLMGSEQGRQECAANNNHGTYYDLQVGAIAAFLGWDEVLFETLIRAQDRIGVQFRPDGSQPEEMARSLQAHYTCFNLQGWLALCELGSRYGTRLHEHRAGNGASMRGVVRRLLRDFDGGVLAVDERGFDAGRVEVIRVQAVMLGLIDGEVEEFGEIKPVFHPHDGIRPFWAFNGSVPCA